MRRGCTQPVATPHLHFFSLLLIVGFTAAAQAPVLVAADGDASPELVVTDNAGMIPVIYTKTWPNCSHLLPAFSVNSVLLNIKCQSLF